MAVQESKLVIVIDSKNALKTTNEVAMGLENLTKKGDQAETQMTAMSASIKSLVGYMGGLLTINKAIAMADGYTQMAARIRNATASAEEYTLVQDRLLDTANGTYRALSEAQEVYLATSGGLKELGYSTKEALDISDSLSYSFVHNATSADKAKSAMDAYGKILDKGKVEADAWFSLMAAVPNILTDVANATGKSTAEIRKLGATGQLAARDLHQGFLLSRDSNNQLADAMENSLADGFMKLNNAVTVYLGKANETTSATGILADGLGVLAKNLDLVASAGAAVGLGYATTALLAKSAAVKQSLVDSAARRAADQVEMQSQVQLAAIEVQRTRQIMALAAQEVHLARLELNSATTREARAAATMRLTQAEVALNIATRNTTTATAAYSAAQAVATTTSLTLAGAARSALAFMTGPVGLGITVATVAAGYLLLGNNSEKTTVSLRENNEAVNDAIQKYRELDDVQKRGQQAAEKVKLSELAEGYKELTTDLNTNAYALSRHNDFTREQSQEVNALIAEFKRTGDLDKFSAAINKLSFVSQDSKDKFNALAGQVRTSGNEYKNQKQFVDAMTNSLNQNASAGDNAARGIRNAADAVAEYTGKLKSQQWDLEFTNAIIQKHGRSAQEADLLLQAYRENEKKGIIGVTIEQKKIISNIEAQRKSAEAYSKSQSESLAKQKKSAKEALSEANKGKKEAERLAEEQFNLREQLVYESAHREKQIELDLAREIAEIRKAKFSPEDTSGLIGNAEARAKYEKELYTEQLKYQLNEWQWTEEEKLDQQVKINRLLILSSRELTDTNKQYSLNSMIDQSNHELALIKLAQETRLFQMREALMSETAAMQERYRLEREQILLNSKLSQEQKQREIALSKALQEEENRRRLNNAVQQWGGIQAEMNSTGDQYRLEQERFGRMDASQDVFNAEMDQVDQAAQDPNANMQEIAAQREAIWQAHHDRMTAIESDYYSNSQALQIAGMGQIASGLTSIVGDMAGEQSLAYKAMFAVEKGFAIAQSALAIQTGVSKAMALGFPQNIPVIAQTVMEGAKIASAIKSITDTGFSGGGFTGYGGKFEPAGIVHKWEGVLTKEEMMAIGGPQGFEGLRKSIRNGSYANDGVAGINAARDTHRVGMGAVSAINSGGSGGKAVIQPKVVINNYSSEKVETSTNQDGELMVTIGKMVNSMVDQKVDQRFLKARRQGGELYGIK